MKRLSIFLCVAMIFATFSCYSSLEYEEVSNIDTSLTKSIDLSSVNGESMKISEQLILRYLKLINKSDSLVSLSPLLYNGDTLAFHVVYNKGWDIMPANKKFAPIMIKSDDKEFDSQNSDIQGLLEYIASVRDDNSINAHKIWNWVDDITPSTKIKPSTGARGFMMGMWRPIDTISSLDVISVMPHIISSRWNQKAPWNLYTPLKLTEQGLRNGPVGCAAVATGQIIHHYRKNNSLGVKFPVSALALQDTVLYMLNNGNTETRWATMANNRNEYDTESAALMLSYLGYNEMKLQYSENDTEYDVEDIHKAFSWGKLNYNTTNGYNFQTVYNSIFNGSPVCIHAQMSNSSQDKHVFIVDRIEEYRYYLAVRCYWDPNYPVTEEEYLSSDPRLFQEYDGSDEMVFEIDQMTDTYFGAIWGYDNSSDDNKLYLTKSILYPFEDEAGYSPGYEQTYSLYWNMQLGHATGAIAMFYNFRNQ